MVVVAALLVVLVVLLAAAATYRFRSVARFRRRRVVLHLKSGPSIAGILAGTWADCFVLERPRYLSENADLKGEAVVLKADVAWLQILEATDEGAQ